MTRAERLLTIQSSLGTSLSGTSSLAKGLRLCLDAALEASGMDSGGVYILNRRRQDLEFKVFRGFSATFVRSLKRIKAGSSHFALAKRGTPLYYDGNDFIPRYSAPRTPPDLREGLRAMAGLPILVNGRLVAGLFVASHAKDRLAFSSRRALEAVAAQIGLAVLRLQAERDLRRSHRQLRILAVRLAEIQENERRHMARELHDRVGQTLAGLALNLNQLQASMPPDHDRKLTERLGQGIRLLEEATDRTRGVIADLRPPLLDDEGLSAALEWYAREFSRRTGIPVRLWIEDTLPRLKTPVENALFRIIQEALTNVQRHARASEAVLSLEANERTIHLLVKDNGAGFNAAKRAPGSSRLHWGLSIMKERATGVGGRMRIVSARGAGTQVLVEVPI